jgi:hypothetical protein
MEPVIKYKRMFKDMSVGTMKLTPSKHIVVDICTFDEGLASATFKIIVNAPFGVETIGEGKASCAANAKQQVKQIVAEYLQEEQNMSNRFV